jgi:hypothetical protein
MLKNREELIENLTEVIHSSKLKSKKRIVNDIKKHLANNYQIVDVQAWVNDPEKLRDVDLRELCLFTEQVYVKTKDMDLDVNPGVINPIEYFTTSEMKESGQFSGILEVKENEMDFPITITNAQIVGNSAYMVTLDIKTIDKLIDNQMLYYDFNLQREAKYVKRKDAVVIEPTLNQNNVKEITNHLLEGTLVPTVLVFNAQTRTADSGTELIFDSNKLTLTITKGTRLAIVDGYHRCRASQNALQNNPELNFNFAILITNYSTKRAQQYQAQLAKATPISTTRIKELEANRLSNTVVQQLKTESDLKGRVSQTNRIHSLNKELVTYNVLSDTIEEEFKMETMADAADVGDFLTEYFNFLIGEFPTEFLNEIEETRKESLINDNNMFVGYIVLARRMFEEGLKARVIRRIIGDIDFSRDTWKERGVVNKEGNLTETNKARKAIKQYFEEIEIK